MANIHPLATVHPNAKLGENVEVGPYAYIEEHVEIGALMSVASTGCSGSKSLFTSTMLDFVSYRYWAYFILDRNDKAPVVPSSIFANVHTFASLLPMTSPFRNSAICPAVNSISANVMNC